MVLQERILSANAPDEDGPAPVLRPDDRPRILMVDDHPLFCEGLQVLLQQEQEFNPVGQAGTGIDALALARRYRPDVILLDIGLPDISGLDLVSQLCRTCPHAKIVVVTGHAEPEYAIAAVRLGVHAFLQKDTRGPAILATLRAVLQGQRVIGQPLALTAVLDECEQVLRERERDHLGLTDQEITILQLAAAGLNNKEIGVRQFWGEITIKRKMRDIYHKMLVNSRAQAVAEAIRVGII